jgi:chromosome segregation ATPase
VVGARVFEWGDLTSLIALSLVFIVVLCTLIVAISGMREGRRISEMLGGRYYQLQEEYKRTQLSLMEAQKNAQQLQEQMEEQRPERLFGMYRQATEELGILHHRLSESERQTGYLTQELLHESEKHEQLRTRLEQERQHLMEEVERWRKRYVESQEQVTRLEQERSDAQQKVEQLTQLRERLLGEISEIGNNKE